MSGRLTDGFRDIIELPWSEFVELEKSPTATNFDSIVTSLARAASKSNLRAIKEALDRLDGKIALEIEVEYPKFYTLYPKATKTANDPNIIDYVEDGEQLSVDTLIEAKIEGGKVMVAQTEKEEDQPSLSLRQVLEKMLDAPKVTPLGILQSADHIDKGEMSEAIMDPKVKSVIVAGLMKMVHEGRMSAVFEVFDQIDGKVADKYKLLGDDVYMYNYSQIAPAGAVKNEDGVYQIEAENTTNAWVARLEQQNKNNRY